MQIIQQKNLLIIILSSYILYLNNNFNRDIKTRQFSKKKLMVTKIIINLLLKLLYLILFLLSITKLIIQLTNFFHFK